MDTWADWFQKTAQDCKPREWNVAPPGKLALAVIGVRRSGKTYATASLANTLSKNACYMNFEDPLFSENVSVKILDELISVYTEFQKKSPELLFFDEIHNIAGWERWIRKMIDLQQYKIILTGSSAKMLSSELATSLTGRCLSQAIWPLSFREFLQFNNRNCRNADEFLGALRDYMQWGGFPEAVLCSDEDQKKKILQQYLTDILYRDIIHRNEIRNPRHLEQLVRFYLTNISSLHSYNSVKNAFGINVETVRDYTRFCEDAFLLFEVNRFHPNLKVQSRDAKKIYVVDTGLRNVNASSPETDSGKLVENIAYLELRRRGKEVTYFKEKGEVDFLITEFGKPVGAVQVCSDDLMNEKTWERETSSLLECLKHLKLKEGMILTLKREENLTLEGKKIALKPLYQWLLEVDTYGSFGNQPRIME